MTSYVIHFNDGEVVPVDSYIWSSSSVIVARRKDSTLHIPPTSIKYIEEFPDDDPPRAAGLPH